jgi:hypothetical protein
MKLLNFSMPSFARIQWVSKEIKEKYEPLLSKAANVYSVLEKESVIHGMRHVTTDNIEPIYLKDAQNNLMKKGLFFVPIQKVGNFEGVNTYHPPVVEGKPWHYYGVVSDNIEYAKKFIEYDKSFNHRGLGELLGYPICCINMLYDVWGKGYTDPIWQQAELIDEKYIRIKESNLIRLKNIPWESNTLLRCIGVGPIFHLKCSHVCEHTYKKAIDLINLGKQLNVDGLKEMEMFLRMPMEWDSYRGIAYIKTPLFRIVCNSMSIVERYVVQIEGTYYPDDAPTRNEFPWSEKLTTIARNGNKI